MLPCSRTTVDLWIAERAMRTPQNSSVDHINSIISRVILHWEATFYPVLTANAILDIPHDFPRNCWTSSLQLDSLHITSTKRKACSTCSCRAFHPIKNFAMVKGSSLLMPPAFFSTSRLTKETMLERKYSSLE